MNASAQVIPRTSIFFGIVSAPGIRHSSQEQDTSRAPMEDPEGEDCTGQDLQVIRP